MDFSHKYCVATGDISGNTGMNGNGRVWYKCNEAVCHRAFQMNSVEVRTECIGSG